MLDFAQFSESFHHFDSSADHTKLNQIYGTLFHISKIQEFGWGGIPLISSKGFQPKPKGPSAP